MTLLGDRIRELRANCSLTQSELARRAGLAQPRISELERGVNRNPTANTLSKIALALGVSLSLLLEARDSSK